MCFVVFGPCAGGLTNGGDRIGLMDDRCVTCLAMAFYNDVVVTHSGFAVDMLKYDNLFPWPLAASALGVDRDMLQWYVVYV